MAVKLTFEVTARRRDAFNPAELLLAAISACMIKGIECVAPVLKFAPGTSLSGTIQRGTA